MEDKLEVISKKLSILIALAIKSSPDNIVAKDNIKLLDSFDLPNSEIASILGMKPNAVSMARGRMNEGKNDKQKEK